ncbi:hypothetical protein EW026_g7730 [Hermanssonia centrifuga]|uniref:Fungal-type protein kinase domain-containing protein n=1 Tax=Hermanssonia centrifuga TaxID=98765 RepID=A0A4S4K8L5_9APHY|nr:hypothetical protein EW026_g7730 [Hermanssonia centrifuga]
MFSRATTPRPVGNPEPRTVTETPHLSRLGLYTLQSGVGLEDKRTVVCEEAGQSVPLVTVDYFLNSVAPGLRPEINVHAVLQKLRDHGDIIGDRWTLFPSDPKDSDEHENVTFKPFEELIQTIASASRCKSVHPTLQLINNPYACPESSHRDNRSRPDSYAILTPGEDGSQDRPLWIDIGGTGEYKKGDAEKDRVDNARKIMWSMHHCMANDPRRRFTFGWTIENTEMRLWHCNRSKRIVTYPFNFVQDHTSLAHFFLSLIYGDQTEIGWDPTMAIVDIGGGKEPQYDITVRSDSEKERVYRTVKMISGVGAESVQGRGTRVWLAVRIVKGKLRGVPVVLKDSWIDHDRKREAIILEEINDAPHCEELVPFARKVFLTVEAHGDVHIDRQVDHTCELIMRVVMKPKRAKPFSVRAGTGFISLTTRHEARKPEPTDFDDKVHYRIVFKEQCKPINEETSLRLIFKALGQTVTDDAWCWLGTPGREPNKYTGGSIWEYKTCGLRVCEKDE